MVIESPRLMLRELTDDDFAALYAVLADPVSMRYYPYVFDEARVRAWIQRNIDRYRTLGFGLWAVCLRETGELIGDCGLTMQPINGQMLPEIGYHIRRDQQRNGYAVEAAKAVQRGEGIEKVLEIAEDWLRHCCCVVVPKDLRYVKRSGRISSAAAFVGDAIGLKPAMTFENGAVKVLAKIRGEKKVPSSILELVKKNKEEDSPYILVCNTDTEGLEKLKAGAAELFGKAPEYVLPLGCAIQINIGPNTIGVIYRKKTET